MPRPNWFFAFPLDGSFVLELPPVPTGLRRYRPEDVHLTLAFLGMVREEAALRALSVLDELLVQKRPTPIDASLGLVTAMGARRSYSALSALLERGRAETEAWIAELRDPLTEAASGRRERRKPKAHVTVARPRRNATDSQRAEGLAWASALDLREVTIRLDQVALYTWSDARHEQLFRIVAERPFGEAETQAGSAVDSVVQ